MLLPRTWTHTSMSLVKAQSPWTCPRCVTHVRWASQKPARKRKLKPGESMFPKQDAATIGNPGTHVPAIDLMLKRYKPRTPGQRHLVRPINDHLWKGGVFRELTFPRKGQHIGGRNNTGRVTVRHRGGGAKRRIRMVDTERKDPGEHRVERIEYDPGRSSHIALIHSVETQKKSYILACDGLREGDTVQSYLAGIPQSLIDAIGGVYDPALIAARTTVRGNCLPLHMIPPGTVVFNIGMRKGSGGQLCRSAGTFGTVIQPPDLHQEKYPLYVLVKLQSGETRRIHREACATVGMASNVNHYLRQLGKAGRSRNLGIRPTVRGVAMNANEHPHGGGRGKSKGNRQPVNPTGRILAKGGFKTRKRRNPNKAVYTPRPRNFGRRRRDVGTDGFER